MAGARLSRRKIAAYFADEIADGRNITKQLAAYLVESKRVREADLVVRDIEAALADRGILLTDVASSRELAAETKQAITAFLKQTTGAKDVHIRSHVDPYLLGGVRIDTPGARMDATLRHKLNQLTASKI
jgi:F-type H+-transporting ATPase subunit delta